MLVQLICGASRLDYAACLVSDAQSATGPTEDAHMLVNFFPVCSQRPSWLWDGTRWVCRWFPRVPSVLAHRDHGQLDVLCADPEGVEAVGRDVPLCDSWRRSDPVTPELCLSRERRRWASVRYSSLVKSRRSNFFMTSIPWLKTPTKFRVLNIR